MTFNYIMTLFPVAPSTLVLGGAIVVLFLDWGCNCSVAPPGYGPGFVQNVTYLLLKLSRLILGFLIKL